MFKRTLKFVATAAVTTAAAVAFNPLAADAQAVRTFVSAQGVDSGTCTLTAPCRSFAYALTQTANEGEIAVLNTAGYGAVTIGQSVSIVNPGGVEAGISAGSGDTAITINIPYYDTVNLRGLTIEGNGAAENGIVMNGSGKLNVLNCDVRDMAQYGIEFTAASDANAVIADTTVANNATAGIYAASANNGLQLNISRSRIVDNGYSTISSSTFGIELVGGRNTYFLTTIDHSLIAQNGVGLSILTPATPNVVAAVLIDTTIMNNGQSLNIGGQTAVTLEKTTIGDWATGTGLSTDAIVNDGTLFSYGDNAILDTLTGNAITPISLK